MSNFIDQAYGFIPPVISITEPAVGFRAVSALGVWRNESIQCQGRGNLRQARVFMPGSGDLPGE